MEKTVKFVQIACATTDNRGDLYGLDAKGQVWMYKWDEKYWRLLPNHTLAWFED